MKSTGIVRFMDGLGRIVLPKETRDLLDIGARDPIEIFIDEDKVILRKYCPCCIFCGNADNVTNYKGKLICNRCIDNLKAITED